MTIADKMKNEVSLLAELQRRGVKVIGTGNQRSAKCPFHEDSRASFSVQVTEGVWKCHAGCGQGSVIDLIAMFEKTSPMEVIKQYGKESDPDRDRRQLPLGKEVATYVYQDEKGDPVYKVVRYDPKDFRPFTPNSDGEWILGLSDVTRVLYNLPAVMKSQTVFVVEGEKDANNLCQLGMTATCNVGGAGKWLEGYSDTLEGKDVIICGDNDKPGREHVELVRQSILDKVRSLRTISVPSPHKDVSDYIASFADRDEAAALIRKLVDEAPVVEGGMAVPIQSFDELEREYIEFTKNLKENLYTFNNWLPSLGEITRGLVPGEVATFVADTGVGKTALLSNLALKAAPMPVLFFELELPGSLLYERFLAAYSDFSCKTVEGMYAYGDSHGKEGLRNLSHIHVCTRAGLTSEAIEKIIVRSSLKTGCKPKLVLLDYIQLCGGTADNRYELVSNIAESIKVIAKRTNTIFIVASQVHRKEEGPEIGLHDAKGSGSIENSSGLVIGVWREPNDKSKLVLRVLKNTKGESGKIVVARFDGEKMRIWEEAKSTANYD